MNTAPTADSQPPSTRTLQGLPAPGRPRLSVLAALARTVRRVLPGHAAARRELAAASAGDETAMHASCL